MNIYDYEWHDAIIKNIWIDRTNPGNVDVIEIEILWPDNTLQRLICTGVYWGSMSLNFGIVADESIDIAYFTDPDSDEDLKALHVKWRNMIQRKLFCFIIKTSSTDSTIKIIAENIEII